MNIGPELEKMLLPIALNCELQLTDFVVDAATRCSDSDLACR